MTARGWNTSQLDLLLYWRFCRGTTTHCFVNQNHVTFVRYFNMTVSPSIMMPSSISEPLIELITKMHLFPGFSCYLYIMQIIHALKYRNASNTSKCSVSNRRNKFHCIIMAEQQNKPKDCSLVCNQGQFPYHPLQLFSLPIFRMPISLRSGTRTPFAVWNLRSTTVSRSRASSSTSTL